MTNHCNNTSGLTAVAAQKQLSASAQNENVVRFRLEATAKATCD